MTKYIMYRDSPVDFINDHGGFGDLRDYQVEYLDFVMENKTSLCKKSRQMGITQLIAGYVAWYIIYNENSSSVFITDRIENGQSFMLKVRDMIYRYDKDLIVSHTKKSIRLENGSRINISKNGIGANYDLYIMDELDWMKKPKDLWIAIAPIINCIQDRKLIMYSTLAKKSFMEELINSERYPVYIADYKKRKDYNIDFFKKFLRDDEFKREVECIYVEPKYDIKDKITFRIDPDMYLDIMERIEKTGDKNVSNYIKKLIKNDLKK